MANVQEIENCPGKKAWGRRYCCVKDCNGRAGLPALRLYRFPGRSWEEQRRKKWIAAVRRVKWSKRTTNFNRTNEHPEVDISSDEAANDSSETVDKIDPMLSELQPTAETMRASCDQACQTEACEGTTPFSIFVCSIHETDACTQINHTITCDAEVQCQPITASYHSGPVIRSSYFGGYDIVKSSSAAMRDLCGVSVDVFALLLGIIPNPADRTCDVFLFDRLVMFLMKMKLGTSFASLAVLFSVSGRTASRHFHGIFRTLTTATQKWIYRPPSHVIMSRMPNCFKIHYPGCTMIIDCTKVRTEKPSTVQQQRVLYSNYKGGYTLKFMVGIAPCGAVCFRSKAYGGRCSDAFITVDSGFLDLVQPGDIIMADKGFPGIKSEVEEAHAVLVMPRFLHGHGQFTDSEILETYNIAQVRIHVERIIQRIKTYNILNSRVTTEMNAKMSDFMCAVF
ncbi:uncharacterized protein [Dermacentor andersoni]|uniref:uncharacterized protein n=1 Tax=Dermacentor andersoni TaxID=34620 RepID=UPI002155F7C6|nr:uncharacterized protein LOC126524206 [Dermacentor andersoni]